MKSIYLKYFKETYMSNFKKAVFEAKLKNDKEYLIELQANIYQNWNLTPKDKEKILKELGIWRIK